MLLIYRRPELTAQVLAAIREARPQTLLVAADAPHPERKEEQELCSKAREVVMQGIDWPCRVETRFAEEHLGCRRAVAEALHWAFEGHEQLIILEDDCLPDLTFFRWCDELLVRYAEEPKIMQICGSNLTGAKPAAELSGYFSRFGPIWGWATWRRAYALYDVEMRSWPEVRGSAALKRLCPEPLEAEWRKELFDSVHSGKVDTWDYQWAYARLLNERLSVIPAVNLVQNIGFGAGATHTMAAQGLRMSLPAGTMQFPLVIPTPIKAWAEADRHYLKTIAGLPCTRREAIVYRLKKLAKRLLSVIWLR